MELKLAEINKSYQRNKVYAIHNLSTTFTSGVYGLLGPNGAGKSTLMNMITDNLKVDSGTITLDGVEIGKLGADYRNILGYMPQQQNLYDHFTGEEFLWYMAALKGLKRKEMKRKIPELLRVVNLQEDCHKKIKSYSGGMKQRILIAQALLNDPKILILDEPTAGLDPKERIRVRNFISEISKERIVLLATHVVSDVESIAKEILIMQKGKIIKMGKPQQLMEELEGNVYEVMVDETEQKQYEESGERIVNMMMTADRVCLRIVTDHMLTTGNIQPVRANLEDVYMYWVR